jgi:hypothetical protein
MSSFNGNLPVLFTRYKYKCYRRYAHCYSFLSPTISRLLVLEMSTASVHSPLFGPEDLVSIGSVTDFESVSGLADAMSTASLHHSTPPTMRARDGAHTPNSGERATLQCHPEFYFDEGTLLFQVSSSITSYARDLTTDKTLYRHRGFFFGSMPTSLLESQRTEKSCREDESGS